MRDKEGRRMPDWNGKMAESKTEMNKCAKAWRYFQKYGFFATCGRIIEKMTEKPDNYEAWIEEVESHYEKIDVDAFAYRPTISILVPVYNVLDKHLIPCIESVLAQEYPNWELCLADDCSTWENVRATLEKYRSRDDRIKVVFREANGHISECTNTALGMATGEYIAFLDCDDVLTGNALSEVVKRLNEDPSLDFVYSDEDKIDDDGKNRHLPHFKPDWSPDTFMAQMYTCHFGVYRRSIALRIGGDKKGYEGAQDYDFTLRFTEQTDRIAHIPRVLYHWRTREGSTAVRVDAKPYVLEATRKSKEDALARRGLQAKLEFVEGNCQLRVNYLWDKYPKVSVIVLPGKHYGNLCRCMETFVEKTDYDDYEWILVDGGSTAATRKRYGELAKKYGAEYVCGENGSDFARLCNLGLRHATGEYLLFLSDGIEMINSEWLKRMVGQAMLPHTGAVGAKLLYPNRVNILHAGIINLENGPAYALTGLKDDRLYYDGKNVLDSNVLAVSGACMLVSRKKFEEVHGFSESPAGLNDVEFCLKLTEKGYYNVVRTDVVLVRHGAARIGGSTPEQREKLYAMHPQFKNTDPFYNCNLAQNRTDFSYNYEMCMKTVRKGNASH